MLSGGGGPKKIRRKWNEIRKLLVYADDANIMDENINTIKEKSEAVLESSKEAARDVKTEKAKYIHIVVSRNHQYRTKSLFTYC